MSPLPPPSLEMVDIVVILTEIWAAANLEAVRLQLRQNSVRARILYEPVVFTKMLLWLVV